MLARILRGVDALLNSILSAFKKVFWMVVVVALFAVLTVVGVFALAYQMFT